MNLSPDGPAMGHGAPAGIERNTCIVLAVTSIGGFSSSSPMYTKETYKKRTKQKYRVQKKKATETYELTRASS
jgi:hypothetical protein